MDELKLVGYVDKFAHVKVAVLGDMMLDRYIWGGASRISQEAPVPVVQVRRQTSVPGGAANVARNVLSLGAQVEVFGVMGDDSDGAELRAHLSNAGAGTDGILILGNRPTTVKTRVLAGNQQVVRIDQEQTDAISPAQRHALRKNLEKSLDERHIDALILEDYAKGVFGKDFMQGIVNYAASKGIITTLDPHPNNAYNVKGLTLMTPNRREAFALAGVKYVPGNGDPRTDKALLKVGGIIRRKWHPKYLLVTLGAGGMALFCDDAPVPLHIPTKARQVFDVSGAGDTVMATMVLALMSGAPVEDAAKIANYAAGVVVGLVGTAAIGATVLKDAIAGVIK